MNDNLQPTTPTAGQRGGIDPRFEGIFTPEKLYNNQYSKMAMDIFDELYMAQSGQVQTIKR